MICFLTFFILFLNGVVGWGELKKGHVDSVSLCVHVCLFFFIWSLCVFLPLCHHVSMSLCFSLYLCTILTITLTAPVLHVLCIDMSYFLSVFVSVCFLIVVFFVFVFVFLLYCFRPITLAAPVLHVLYIMRQTLRGRSRHRFNQKIFEKCIFCSALHYGSL